MGGLISFPTQGNITVIVAGARIIITVSPAGPPWYVYSNLTWVVQALYDDGSQASGNGYIVVEKDGYEVSNITWAGELITIDLPEIGYDSYLKAVLVEPTGSIVSNYSLVVAIPKVNVSVGNITINATNLTSGGVGVELMSFQIETYQMAALKDGVLTMLFIGLALLPYMLRRYYRFFQGPIGLLIWTTVLFGITLTTMIGRSQIPIDAYVVQTANGTTIKPVYVDNPFVKAYMAPLIIEIMVIFHNIIQLMGDIMDRMMGGRRWR